MEIEPANSAQVGVPLAPLTTMRVGGQARLLVEASDTDALVASVIDADRNGDALLLIAGGSNLVVSDNGFDGICVLVRTRGIEIESDGDSVRVTAAAGERWDRLVAQLVGDGISGVEALSGIPGSVGATPFQNVGAYGVEVSHLIESVTVFDRVEKSQSVVSNADCGFSYRASIFKEQPDRWVILSVSYRLRRGEASSPIRYPELADRLSVSVGDRAPAEQVRRAVLELRRSKGMVLDIDDHDTWSCGSFFTNPIVSSEDAASLPSEAPRWTQPDGSVKVSAAWLIEAAGFRKGFSLPGSSAAISSRHTLAITNRGSATSGQILELAEEIQRQVEAQFAVHLEPEPRLI